MDLKERGVLLEILRVLFGWLVLGWLVVTLNRFESEYAGRRRNKCTHMYTHTHIDSKYSRDQSTKLLISLIVLSQKPLNTFFFLDDLSA